MVQWLAKSLDFTIRIPDTHTVRYSEESSIQVFGIQMVVVHQNGAKIYTIQKCRLL